MELEAIGPREQNHNRVDRHHGIGAVGGSLVESPDSGRAQKTHITYFGNR